MSVYWQLKSAKRNGDDRPTRSPHSVPPNDLALPHLWVSERLQAQALRARRGAAVSNYVSASPAAVRARSDYFWARVDQAQDGCWRWMGSWDDKHGPQMQFAHAGVKHRLPATRASLILHGVELDPDDVVYRTCRNGLCVSPEHLRIGDHEDNVAQRVALGRSAHGEGNGRAKLTEEDVTQIKRQLLRGVTRTELAAAYGVDSRAIWGIDAGRTWKHVDPAPKRSTR
ncbi:hypothetical protein LCGC14_2412920 [marine sediment metagenome]|uniref:HNH nuclease domain-containing protein n=1 Tax=marine sediment metagenome TaxID=412755 RepID=A0A0F9BRZ9_9ZZZZ